MLNEVACRQRTRRYDLMQLFRNGAQLNVTYQSHNACSLKVKPGKLGLTRTFTHPFLLYDS